MRVQKLAKLVNYVGDINGLEVTIDRVSPEVAKDLRALGAQQTEIGQKTIWVIRANNREELGFLFGRFRDLGIMFAGSSSGWPPAEVFLKMREEGKVEGKFQEVFSRGAGEWYCRWR